MRGQRRRAAQGRLGDAGAVHWVAELSRERVPWGEQPPGGQNHTEKSTPRRRGQKPGPKARVGKDLAPSTSAVLPVSQRNQIHRVSGSSGSLIIIKESATPAREDSEIRKIRKVAVRAFAHSACPWDSSLGGKV